MTSKTENLIAADKESRLIQAAYELSCVSDEDRRTVCGLLSDLNNKGDIDLIVAFSSLKNNATDGSNFFLSRHLFEKALPTLVAPVMQVMACVQHLAKEAGNDMAANTVFEPFIDFLATESSRPSQALEVIHKAPDQWFGFVCSTILAGTRINLQEYFNSAIELVSHDVSGVSINAIYSLGRISYPEDSGCPERAIDEIGRFVTGESDDDCMAVVVKTAISLARSNPALAEKAHAAILTALGKGSNHVLHSATEEFCFHTKHLPDELLNLLISVFPLVKAENKASISNIDLGVSTLLKSGNVTQAIDCLETMLIANASTLNLGMFSSVVHEILRGDITTINKLLTRWFLTGEKALCNGISEIVESVHGNQLHLEIRPEDLPDKDAAILVFLARKAIGYLFINPVSVASIIISILRCTTEANVLKGLQGLLLDRVLLNYPRSVREFLESQIPRETDQVADVIKSALHGVDEYFEELGNIGTIPELHPTLQQREAYLRRFNRQMSESYKEAMKGSLVEMIATKSVLLYGRSSINYVHQGSDNSSRMEIPLTEHSVEMDFPRRHNLDPVGEDYMLRVFRAERLVEK